jgi:type IV pilus assembly protein PilA
MRFSLKRQQGFTLIEIIIVVVILGILAAVALPKITANIDKVRAAEAFSVLGTTKSAFDRCIEEQTGGLRVAVAADITRCDTFAELGVTVPAAGNFTYAFAGVVGNTIPVVATIRAAFGTVGVDFITFTYNIDGTVAKTCAGKFFSMCQN